MRFLKAIKIPAIAFIYFVFAVLSLHLSFEFSNASPVWPASGFAFAVALIWGPRVVVGVFAGAFFANLYVFLNNHVCTAPVAIFISLLIAAGNTAECLAGYFLLKKFLPATKTGDIFRHVQSVYRFIVVALIMCLASCTIGSTSTLLAKVISLPDLPIAWFTWWTGDVSGVLLVTPLIVIFSHKPFHIEQIPRQKIFETVLMVIAVIVMSGIVFRNWLHPNFVFSRAFIITPFLIWTAIRLEYKFGLVLLFYAACIALIGTLQGTGPLITNSLNESLLTVEGFISINTVMILLLQAAISERKAHEQYLKDARTHLEEVVQMRTKELHFKNAELEKRNNELLLFSYAASHDLREPLRKIEFFTGKIMETETHFSEKGKDLFRRMKATTQRMNQLIETLLSYSLLEEYKEPLKLTDLNVVLEDAKKELSSEIQQAGAIIDSGTLPTVRAIPFQFQLLFTNILGNSLKFRRMEISPRITIESELVQQFDLPGGQTVQGAAYFHLTFRDNGIGFEKEYAGTVFEILQKLHGQKEYEGTGIGLAICKKIVEKHKGFIYADAEPGIGASFHIFLKAEINGDLVRGEQKTENQYH